MVDYESDMRIDESALDVEWLEQPMLMMKYARIAVESKQKVDKAKERLEVVRARLDRNIRMDPEAFEVEKITEPVVAATILLQPEYEKANEVFSEAQYQDSMARYAVRAVDQRKSALENLVRLHGQQYFAGPKMPRDLGEERKQRERIKEADSKVKITRGKK